MSKLQMIKKNYPIGSTWSVPRSYHPYASQAKLPAGNIKVEVINHIVGAGLRRDADSGIRVRADDGYTFDIIDSGYLP